MQARVMRTTASVGLTIVASGTFSTRTSPARYMIVARIVHPPLCLRLNTVLGSILLGVGATVTWGFVTLGAAYLFLSHRSIHLDERRPRAFETFAGNFL